LGWEAEWRLCALPSPW